MGIKVINILKDGTVAEDMSTITVPKEITEAIKNLRGEGK